ncbi:uncharacterized protein LOC126598694 isoform X2 [Malus sylvestris]|uniref:uncharacterized protein LOC126598694 isoform X2 n=1 Tax=Malus sylvestris TaxID=3752 RepID=UPI0021AC6F9E|nr:uncharacterized protein LOC126598694 isoform X2 [Malus sylvestris]
MPWRSLLYLAPRLGGLRPETAGNPDILGFRGFRHISNFYLDWVFVDFKVGMGKVTKKLSFSSCRLVFLLLPLLIVLLFVDQRLTTLHVIPFIKQASLVAASLRLVVGQTILQP